ncbi:hypothetical protein ACWD0B_20615, partial [Streptomyces cellulosae]
MTRRTPRLSRLRRAVPEGRAGRPAETRGARPRRRGAQPKVVALGDERVLHLARRTGFGQAVEECHRGAPHLTP